MSAGTFVALLTVLLIAYRAGAQHEYLEAIVGGLGPADRARPVDHATH